MENSARTYPRVWPCRHRIASSAIETPSHLSCASPITGRVFSHHHQSHPLITHVIRETRRTRDSKRPRLPVCDEDRVKKERTEQERRSPAHRTAHTHHIARTRQETNGARFFAQRCSRSSSCALAGLAGGSGDGDVVSVVCLVMNYDVCVMKESIWQMEKSRFGFSNLGFCLSSCELSTRTKTPLSHASRPASARRTHPLHTHVHPLLLSLSGHFPPRTAKPPSCASSATPIMQLFCSVMSHCTVCHPSTAPYAYLPARACNPSQPFRGEGGRVPACMHACTPPSCRIRFAFPVP